MSKPLGCAFTVDEHGLPHIGVRMPSRVEDSVWDAVREAIAAGWTVERFRRECASAWDDALNEDRKSAEKEWSRP